MQIRYLQLRAKLYIRLLIAVGTFWELGVIAPEIWQASFTSPQSRIFPRWIDTMFPWSDPPIDVASAPFSSPLSLNFLVKIPYFKLLDIPLIQALHQCFIHPVNSRRSAVIFAVHLFCMQPLCSMNFRFIRHVSFQLKRLLVMSMQVSLQASRLRKCLGALPAFVWFFSCVRAHMSFKVSGSSEGSWALFALVWFLTGVIA